MRCCIWVFSLCCQARLRARPSFRSVLVPRRARSSSWCSWRPWTLEGADGDGRDTAAWQRRAPRETVSSGRCLDTFRRLRTPISNSGGTKKTSLEWMHFPTQTVHDRRPHRGLDFDRPHFYSRRIILSPVLCPARAHTPFQHGQSVSSSSLLTGRSGLLAWDTRMHPASCVSQLLACQGTATSSSGCPQGPDLAVASNL